MPPALGGAVACGRMLDAMVRSSRDTVGNGERSNALPRHKVHGLALMFSKKPDATTQAFRAAAKAAPANESISTNGANRPTQRPRVRNVWRCHWLSKGRARTKQITSQTWARLDVSGGGPLLWHLSISTDALQRISMTARSSRNCLQATGHAFHWLSWSEQETRGWPNDSRRQHLDQGLQPSKQPNVGPFGRLDGWSTGGWDPLQN